MVFTSGAPGAGPCPAALGGLCLGLVAPTVLGSATADNGGTATVRVAVPAGAPLVDLHLQAAHGGATPAVSPVLERPVVGRLTGDPAPRCYGNAVDACSDEIGDPC